MASILRRYIILHDFIDEPEFTREFTPFDINMLNALEEAARMSYRLGKLTEVSHTYWEFEYERDGRRQKLRIQSTDEFLDSKKTVTSKQTISPPRFK